MNILQKLGKLGQAATYERAWRRAQRSMCPLPLAPIKAKIDRARLQEIQNRYADAAGGFAKYTDVDRWLLLARERVQNLKLNRTSPQRVLDLGCGGGFFLFILKQLGHDVLGLDIDVQPLYGELIELFALPRVIWMIQRFEPLPDLKQRFDWITAFSISFDRAMSDRPRWGPREWNFLLEELQQRHLEAGGKMYFEVNPGAAGNFYTPELRDFFMRRGAKRERGRRFCDRGLR